MLPTPSTSHVNNAQIYEPAEDTFLFLDTISSPAEIEFLSERFRHKHARELPASPDVSPLVLEIGTGSGAILAFLTAHAEEIFGRRDILTIGSDINHFACQAAQDTVSRACLDAKTHREERNYSTLLLATLEADLTSSFRAGSIDVLIFNPPYVPSPGVPILAHPGDSSTAQSLSHLSNFERDSVLLSLSYEGGREGMEVTNRLLEQLPIILCEAKGMAYVMLCHQNKPTDVIERIRGWGPRWSVEVVGRSDKTGGWEKLLIVRICRRPV